MWAALILTVLAQGDAGVPTCARPWGSSGSMLADLQADDSGATVCAALRDVTECVRVDFESGAFHSTVVPVRVNQDVPAFCDSAACAKWFTDVECVEAAERPRVQLDANRWALLSEQPLRIDVIRAKPLSRERSIALPTLSWVGGRDGWTPPKGARAALGVTPCGTTWGSELVKLPDGRLVVASSFGVAVVRPDGKQTRIFRFPACPAR